VAKKVKKPAEKAAGKAAEKASTKKKPVTVEKTILPKAKNTPKNGVAAKKTEPDVKSAKAPAKSKNKSSSEAKPKAVQGSTKTYLTKAELEHFKQLLLEKLHQLSGDVESIESEMLRKNRADASGDLSSMPIHMADVGSDTFEQDFALGLMSSERKIVAEIIAALKRIQNGTYGICEGTGKPIPKIRLEASPWARYCVDYAARLEKGLESTQEQSRRRAIQSEGYEQEDEVEPEEAEEQDEEDEKDFEPLETDPDLEDLYEIEDDDSEPSADEEHG
jgi:RNA polymerase-binding protein DksA